MEFGKFQKTEGFSAESNHKIRPPVLLNGFRVALTALMEHNFVTVIFSNRRIESGSRLMENEFWDESLSCRRWRVIALGFLALCVGFPLNLSSSNAEPLLHISAKFETGTYSPLSNTTPAWSRTFSVECLIATNGTWRISNTFLVNGEQVWVFDGTNVYDFNRMVSPPSSNALQRARLKGFGVVPFEIAKSNTTTTIDEALDGCPLGDTGVNLPWLAFCSGNYLKKPGRKILYPVSHLHNAPDAFGYDDKTDVFNDELSLPKHLELYYSRELYKQSTLRFQQAHFLRNRLPPPPIADHTLKFRYDVIESTNVAGWHIPTKFEYVQFDFMQDGQPFPHYRGVATVESIILSDAAQLDFPEKSGTQTVVDWRFRNEEKQVNGITYPWNNGPIPPTNNPELQQIFHRRCQSIIM
jgi:hypothetical protein